MSRRSERGDRQNPYLLHPGHPGMPDDALMQIPSALDEELTGDEELAGIDPCRIFPLGEGRVDIMTRVLSGLRGRITYVQGVFAREKAHAMTEATYAVQGHGTPDPRYRERAAAAKRKLGLLEQLHERLATRHESETRIQRFRSRWKWDPESGMFSDTQNEYRDILWSEMKEGMKPFVDDRLYVIKLAYEAGLDIPPEYVYEVFNVMDPDELADLTEADLVSKYGSGAYLPKLWEHYCTQLRERVPDDPRHEQHQQDVHTMQSWKDGWDASIGQIKLEGIPRTIEELGTEYADRPLLVEYLRRLESNELVNPPWLDELI